MPGRTARVTITERQHDLLQAIRNAPTASSQLRQRATIVLSAFHKRSDEEIATESRVVAAAGWHLAATLGRCLASTAGQAGGVKRGKGTRIGKLPYS